MPRSRTSKRRRASASGRRCHRRSREIRGRTLWDALAAARWTATHFSFSPPFLGASANRQLRWPPGIMAPSLAASCTAHLGTQRSGSIWKKRGGGGGRCFTQILRRAKRLGAAAVNTVAAARSLTASGGTAPRVRVRLAPRIGPMPLGTRSRLRSRHTRSAGPFVFR